MKKPLGTLASLALGAALWGHFEAGWVRLRSIPVPIPGLPIIRNAIRDTLGVINDLSSAVTSITGIKTLTDSIGRAAQQAQTMTELTVQKARIHSELIQILTPDQKSKLNKFMERHEQRFMRHAAPEPPPSE